MAWAKRFASPSAALLLLALGCGSQEKPPVQVPHYPFTQEIEGTSLRFEMIPVPIARIVMPPGPEGGHKRELEIKPFYMGRTEVTRGLYAQFLGELRVGLSASKAQGSPAPPIEVTLTQPADLREPPRYAIGVGDEYPVCRISYYNATKFCEWLSQKTGKHYRLPTEFEWEYAARVGARGVVDPAHLPAVAWFEDNSGGKPHPVGTLAADPLGFCDMLGNVAEWCVGTDGKPVARGGSWLTPANRVNYELRQTEQFWWNVEDSRTPRGNWWLAGGDFVGMRVVCEE